MGFHIGANDLPRLWDFRRADELERAIVPIRGSGPNAGVKPICVCNRAATHMQIRGERDVTSPLGGKGRAVMCRLYNTDCVTYYEDGSLTLYTNGWWSMSTRLFVNHIIPVGHLENCSGDDSAMLYVVGGKAYRFTDKLHLTNDMQPISPEVCSIHIANRKALNEVKKLYTPFLKHITPLLKLAYDPRRKQQGRPEVCKLLTGSLPAHDAGFICSVMRHDNKEDWADLLDELANKHAVLHHVWGGSSWEWSHSYRPDRIRKAMIEAMKYTHSDAVFVATQLPLGQWKRDNNYKYVQFVQYV